MDNVIALGRGDPDFHTPRHIVEAAKKALDENKHHYTPPTGLPELRKSISKNFELKYNLDYLATHPMFGPDSGWIQRPMVYNNVRIK